MADLMDWLTKLSRAYLFDTSFEEGFLAIDTLGAVY